MCERHQRKYAPSASRSRGPHQPIQTVARCAAESQGSGQQRAFQLMRQAGGGRCVGWAWREGKGGGDMSDVDHPPARPKCGGGSEAGGKLAVPHRQGLIKGEAGRKRGRNRAGMAGAADGRPHQGSCPGNACPQQTRGKIKRPAHPTHRKQRQDEVDGETGRSAAAGGCPLTTARSCPPRPVRRPRAGGGG